jgi:hypothetical protein
VNPEWLTAFTALAVAVAGCLLWCARKAWHASRRVSHFLDDYAGEPARDGLPARPGFMARLGSVEESMKHLSAEMSPNHGSSLRDVVHKTAADVAEIKSEQAAVRVRLELFDAQRPREEKKP